MPGDRHGDLGHYGIMVTVAIGVLIGASLGSTAIRGWRIPTILSALAAAGIGVTSIALPNAASSLGFGRGLVVILWAIGLAWVAAIRSIGKNEYPHPKKLNRYE